MESSAVLVSVMAVRYLCIYVAACSNVIIQYLAGTDSASIEAIPSSSVVVMVYLLDWRILSEL